MIENATINEEIEIDKQYIKEIEEEFHVSHERATEAFGKAKAFIYDKYK